MRNRINTDKIEDLEFVQVARAFAAAGLSIEGDGHGGLVVTNDHNRDIETLEASVAEWQRGGKR